MVAKAKAQIHMDDNIIRDEELEAMLETRDELKQSVTEFRAADKRAKAKIQTVKAAMPFRVGRFIISKLSTPARVVSFEAEAGSRISIKNIDAD